MDNMTRVRYSHKVGQSQVISQFVTSTSNKCQFRVSINTCTWANRKPPRAVKVKQKDVDPSRVTHRPYIISQKSACVFYNNFQVLHIYHMLRETFTNCFCISSTSDPLLHSLAGHPVFTVVAFGHSNVPTSSWHNLLDTNIVHFQSYNKLSVPLTVL
jgi:hypothetical protein